MLDALLDPLDPLDVDELTLELPLEPLDMLDAELWLRLDPLDWLDVRESDEPDEPDEPDDADDSRLLAGLDAALDPELALLPPLEGLLDGTLDGFDPLDGLDCDDGLALDTDELDDGADVLDALLAEDGDEFPLLPDDADD